MFPELIGIGEVIEKLRPDGFSNEVLRHNVRTFLFTFVNQFNFACNGRDHPDKVQDADCSIFFLIDNAAAFCCGYKILVRRDCQACRDTAFRVDIFALACFESDLFNKILGDLVDCNGALRVF